MTAAAPALSPRRPPGATCRFPTARSGDCAVTIYALIDEDQTPRYVGRTARPLSDRLSSHRRARRAQWLRECNAELAAWLEANVPAAVVLDEVPDDADPWPAEKAWIGELAEAGLFNKTGNPRRRRGGTESAVAA